MDFVIGIKEDAETTDIKISFPDGKCFKSNIKNGSSAEETKMKVGKEIFRLVYFNAMRNYVLKNLNDRGYSIKTGGRPRLIDISSAEPDPTKREKLRERARQVASKYYYKHKALNEPIQ